MSGGIVAFLLKYKFIILFYLVVIVLLFLKRKKIDVQAKIIFLYRMQWGIKWMDKYAKKLREWIVLLGYIATGIGFIGQVFISVLLIKNIYDLVVNPAAVPGVSLVLPGVNIPGLGILPFWYWLIAIFIIAIVHEFGHGIVARAHNITVKNTGIVLFGPIIGAFVEPDEAQMRKQKDITQYSVLSAGAFTNIILAFIALGLLTFVSAPLQQTMVEPAGFTFDTYVDEALPFAQAGIMPGTIITGLNDKTTANFEEFHDELGYHKPGEEVIIHTKEKEYEITLSANPTDERLPFLGIQNIRNEIEVKEQYTSGLGKVGFVILEWFNGLASGGRGFFFWLYLLSLGIGLFNLLPLPIVDGGRMVQVFFHKLKGKEKGEKRYRQVSAFFLLLLVLSLLSPLLAKLF